MEKKSEYLYEIWGYHNLQYENYIYFTYTSFVFLSRFSGTIIRKDRNGKSDLVLT